MRHLSAGAGGAYNASTIASIRPNHPYFTEFTLTKGLLYGVATVYVIGTGVASILELFLDLPCLDGGPDLGFENPAYDGTQCPHIRHWQLLGLTSEECSFARRLVASILMGGFIGWERRQADRPAGIRTMALVSLGSCLFTIDSTFAFVNGPMNWDASRISAAIPSGVGFLGAGLIFKKEDKETASMVVHGLTTAASVWLSAAVGIACGGELYFAASFGVAIMMLLLRFGPRSDSSGDDESTREGGGGSGGGRPNLVAFETRVDLLPKTDGGGGGYGSTSTPHLQGVVDDVESQQQDETTAIITASERGRRPKNVRKRAALASLV